MTCKVCIPVNKPRRNLKNRQTNKLISEKMCNYWWKREILNLQFDPEELDHGFKYYLKLPADYPHKKIFVFLVSSLARDSPLN